MRYTVYTSTYTTTHRELFSVLYPFPRVGMPKCTIVKRIRRTSYTLQVSPSPSRVNKIPTLLTGQRFLWVMKAYSPICPPHTRPGACWPYSMRTTQHCAHILYRLTIIMLWKITILFSELYLSSFMYVRIYNGTNAAAASAV